MSFALELHFASTWLEWVGDLVLLAVAIALFVAVKRKSSRKSHGLTHPKSPTHL